jgi:hypothetical protein
MTTDMSHFKDTRGVIRSCMSKDRQHNDQKIEDTRGVIRSCISKKDRPMINRKRTKRQTDGQQKKTSNGPQNTTQKTKDLATWHPLRRMWTQKLRNQRSGNMTPTKTDVNSEAQKPKSTENIIWKPYHYKSESSWTRRVTLMEQEILILPEHPWFIVEFVVVKQQHDG